MRKGWTLLELIVALTVFAAVSIAMGTLFQTVVADIPRAKRAIDVNAELTRMLAEMQEDVDAAGSLPAAVGGRKAGDKTLLIDRPDGAVCYQLGKNQVTRSRLAADGKGPWREEDVWPVPNAEIEWRVRQAGGRRHAVAVRTAVRVRLGRESKKRLMNARVFFLGSMRPGGEKP